jgi:hypothetical protein
LDYYYVVRGDKLYARRCRADRRRNSDNDDNWGWDDDIDWGMDWGKRSFEMRWDAWMSERLRAERDAKFVRSCSGRMKMRVLSRIAITTIAITTIMLVALAVTSPAYAGGGGFHGGGGGFHGGGFRGGGGWGGGWRGGGWVAAGHGAGRGGEQDGVVGDGAVVGVTRFTTHNITRFTNRSMVTATAATADHTQSIGTMLCITGAGVNEDNRVPVTGPGKPNQVPPLCDP